MKHLIMCLSLAACDIDVSDFHSSSHKEEYHQYCGICVGYQNSQYPAEIYLVLEDCIDVGNNTYSEGVCKHNNCSMQCRPEDFICTGVSRIIVQCNVALKILSVRE